MTVAIALFLVALAFAIGAALQFCALCKLDDLVVRVETLTRRVRENGACSEISPPPEQRFYRKSMRS